MNCGIRLLALASACLSLQSASLHLEATRLVVTAESCGLTNRAVDPGEEVYVAVTFRNLGTNATPEDTLVTLEDGGGVTGLGPARLLGELAPGGAATCPFRFQTAPLPCGTLYTATFRLSHQADGTPLGSVSYTDRMGWFRIETNTFSVPGFLSIPDGPGTAVSSTVTVTNHVGLTRRVAVYLHGLTHSYTKDLDLVLEGPAGQKVTLMSDVGGVPGDLTGVTAIELVVAEPATNRFSNQRALLAGEYLPEDFEPGDQLPAPGPSGPYRTDLLAAFSGPPEHVNGKWTLWLADDQPGDRGALNSGWSLVLEDEILSCCVPGAPTISDIAGQDLLEDDATTVLFQVGDARTSAAQLLVAAVSDNPELLPAEGLRLSGLGPERRLDIRPTPNANGFAKVTLTVRDTDGNAAEKSFLVTVHAVNDPAVISPVNDLEVLVGQAAKVSVDIGDVETPADQLVLLAYTGNPELVPQAGLSVTGQGARRTLELTPVPQRAGQCVITLAVVDGDGATTSETFVFAVRASSPPALSPLPDVRLSHDSVSLPLRFQVQDDLTPPEQILLAGYSSAPALLPNEGIVFGGSGSNRSVVLRPLPGQTGSSTVTVEARDQDGRIATRHFNLTVLASNQPPGVSAVADQIIAEDGVLQCTVQAFDAEAGTLTLTAAPTDAALFPAGSLTVTGDGREFVVVGHPAMNRSGQTQVVLVVSDGLDSATNSFRVVVQPVNDPPSVRAPDSITSNEDTAVTFEFEVEDAEDTADQLRVEVRGFPARLVPAAGVRVGGTGMRRSVAFTPALNAYGDGGVSLSVRDSSGALTYQTIPLRIRAVPDAPVLLPIPDQFVAMGTTLEVPIAVTDVDTPAELMRFTADSFNSGLIPAQNVRVDRNGSGFVLHLTPTAGQTGRAGILLAVHDEAGLVVTTTFAVVVRRPESLNLLSDLDGDGYSDLLWRHTSGAVAAWFLDDGRLKSSASFRPSQAGSTWQPAATADLNGDGHPDLLWQGSDGRLAYWLMLGVSQLQSGMVSPSTPGDGWELRAAADLNGDQQADLIFQHRDGTIAAWFLDGTRRNGTSLFEPSHPGDARWRLVGAADLDRDGYPDLVWQHAEGWVAVWLMNGVRRRSGEPLSPSHPGAKDWRLAALGDYDGDGSADLAWQHRDGTVALWFLQGTERVGSTLLPALGPADQGWRLWGGRPEE